CGASFSDTLPGGFANNIHNNVHAGVGPIKLKAGDSTSFVVAFLGSPDSTSWEATVSNLNRLYQSFWLSPEPPCMSNIVSAQTFGGNRQYNTSIRLFFDQSVNSCVDRFLLSQATVLKTSTLARDIRLRVLNPDIVNNIRAIALPPGTALVDTVPRDTLPATVNACRVAATFSTALCQIRTGVARGAVESLFIFKSCDNGATYTSDAGVACTPSPSRDPAGAFPRYSWQSYARLSRDARGLFPVTYSDGGVTGGLTYTYVVAGKSWDAIWDVVDINAAGQLAPTKFSIRPGAANGLTANSANRNVSVVYLPVTRQAGSDSSLVTILPGLAADTIAQWSIATRLTKPVRGADITGRLMLSDSAEVEVFDADITRPGITSTVVRLFQLGDTGTIVGTTNSRRRIAVRRDTFVVADTVTVDAAGFPATTVVTTGNSSRTFYRYRSGGRVGPQVTFVDGNRPIYVTDTIPPSNATADLPLVPAQTVPRNAWNGLSIGLDLSVARTINRRAWSITGIGNQSANSAPSITWNPTGTGVQRDATFKGFSKYRITFGGPDWGPTPMTFDRNNPANTNTQVAATLAARPSVGNSDVSATAATALSRALGRTITTDSLAVVKLPFSVKNVRLGNSDVTVALLKSQRPTTIVLGTGGDTVRVSVPTDQWIAGDNLYFIERFNVVKEDTTAASPLTRRVALTSAGVPDSIAQTNVTWGPVILGCASVINCNPITGIGGTGYTQTNANQVYEITYFASPQGIYSFPYTISAEKVASKASDLTEASLENVRVVPNPYVMFSQYEQSRGTKRLMFSGLPPTGTIRIYTASGQTVQEIKWVASDLDRNCTATVNTTQCAATGDLLWNMRSRENLEIGPGFYVFVISTDAGGKKIDKLGKFVVIH
ncbi:MAG: hypothetical protein K2X99_12155, partial [Gemmatimonadaceae bacterium]|nr:hypothetical protein [Gemmatimonadaceae bacterium]